jgi:hypothetical protein
MEKYPEYWNEEMETLASEKFHDVQEKAFLKTAYLCMG